MSAQAFILLVIFLVISSPGTFAQDETPNPNEQSQVSVSVFITDAHGNPVTGIREGDVFVEDEHKPPVAVIGMTHDTSPLRLGVLIDKSNSQRLSELYKPAVEGLNEFLERVLLKDADRVFVEAFDTLPDQPTQWIGASEVGNVRLNLQPSGATSLFDAIERACRERFADKQFPARRVLVLLSDGSDDQSHASLDAAIEAAQQTKTSIIAISTGNSNEHRGTSVLKNLAESTGGYAFVDLRPKEMPEIYSQIAKRLDSMFQVVYVPASSAGGKQPHLLQIKPASGTRLHIQAPKRYYAAIP